MSSLSWLLIAIVVIILIVIVALVARSRSSGGDVAAPEDAPAAAPENAPEAAPEAAPGPDGEAPESRDAAGDGPRRYRPGDPIPDDPTLTDGHGDGLFTRNGKQAAGTSEAAGTEGAAASGPDAPTGVPEPRSSTPVTDTDAAETRAATAGTTATAAVSPTAAAGPEPTTGGGAAASGAPQAVAEEASTSPEPGPSVPDPAPVTGAAVPAPEPGRTGTAGTAGPTATAGTAGTAAPGPQATPRPTTGGPVSSMSVADGAPLWTVSAEDLEHSEPASGPAMASLDSGLIGPAAASPGERPARPADPYPGAVRAPADGSEPPPTHPVKVHTGSGRYHTEESPYYVRTRADLYFVGADEAEAAGFVPWNSRPGGTR